MGFVNIFLVVFAITSVAWLGKISARKGVPAFDLTFVLFLVATVFGYFFARFMKVQPEHFTSQLWIISVIAGVGGSIAVFVFNYAIRIGHFGFSNAIYRSSFLIPVVFGILFLNVKLNLITYAGIFSILISIFLISWSNESFDRKKKNELVWFFIILLAFLLSGLPRIGQLLISVNKLNSSAYLFASYAAGFAVLLLMFIRKPKIKGRAWIYGSIAAIASFIGVFCTIEALKTLPAAVVFPITLSAPIILGLGISYLLYKEKIKFIGFIGILLGIAGIIILALQTYYK